MERGKKYKKAALALVLLLEKIDLWTEKRGFWFIRLIMNLKHLKMKNEAMRICDLALSRQGKVASAWVSWGQRNQLLKVRLALFSEIIRAE